MTAKTRAEIRELQDWIRILTKSRDEQPKNRSRVKLHDRCIKIKQKQIEELENL